MANLNGQCYDRVLSAVEIRERKRGRKMKGGRRKEGKLELT
jgi:hypothetical protein